jgi:hypothetical protein
MKGKGGTRMDAFLLPHQYNFIRNQVELLQHQFAAVHDPDVRDAVRYSAAEKIFDLLPVLTPEQEILLTNIRDAESEQDLLMYLTRVEPFVQPFPTISESRIRQLFKKTKKLHVPPLHSFEWTHTTFLSWNDTGNRKKYFVYPLNGEWIGVEGTYLPSIQKGICAICHTYSDITLVTVTTRRSTEQHQTIGHYMCIDSDACNQAFTKPDVIETFLARSQKK